MIHHCETLLDATQCGHVCHHLPCEPIDIVWPHHHLCTITPFLVLSHTIRCHVCAVWSHHAFCIHSFCVMVNHHHHSMISSWWLWFIHQINANALKQCGCDASGGAHGCVYYMMSVQRVKCPQKSHNHLSACEKKKEEPTGQCCLKFSFIFLLTMSQMNRLPDSTQSEPFHSPHQIFAGTWVYLPFAPVAFASETQTNKHQTTSARFFPFFQADI